MSLVDSLIEETQYLHLPYDIGSPFWTKAMSEQDDSGDGIRHHGGPHGIAAVMCSGTAPRQWPAALPSLADLRRSAGARWSRPTRKRDDGFARS
jgi:hypothetical protein